jgi:hypothetical protein
MTSDDMILKLHIRGIHMQCLPAELLQEDVHVETPLSIQQSDLQATRVRCPSDDCCKDKACVGSSKITVPLFCNSVFLSVEMISLTGAT